MLALTACGTGEGGAPNSAKGDAVSAVARLGEKIFHDASLSEPPGMSCASCHVAALAHASNRVVEPGAVAGRTGLRNAPSLRYLAFNPAFSFGEEGPVGGLFRDGRARTLTDQAGRPFLNPNEMNNAGAADVAGKLARGSYSDEFRNVWGAAVFDDPQAAFEKAAAAVAAYQKESPEFAPFSSKFDAWRAGRTQLTEAELQGMVLFNDPAKGNCAACHTATPVDATTPPLFTDFTYDALGVPRNPAIADNRDPRFFDLGLCGPERTDISDPTLCGAFKVPTLRNIALTAPYFHNGLIASLRDAVKFYVTRDTDPGLWYPRAADGSIRKFDDLPARYQLNPNMTEAPYNRTLGQAPALNDAEIDLVVAFLMTLTDGYEP